MVQHYKKPISQSVVRKLPWEFRNNGKYNGILKQNQRCGVSESEKQKVLVMFCILQRPSIVPVYCPSAWSLPSLIVFLYTFQVVASQNDVLTSWAMITK